MVRLGQRNELEAYFRQFLNDLRTLSQCNLDLARSRFIALVAAVTTSTLEIGADPSTEVRISEAAAAALESQDAEKLMQRARFYLEHAIICARPNANRYASKLIEKCKQIIAAEYASDLTDDSMAQAVNMSRSHFRHLFKELTGIPFKKYLTEVRLNAARNLVLTSSLSIKEICSAVGYSDTSSFYRAYRGYHGVPPTAHRQPSI